MIYLPYLCQKRHIKNLLRRYDKNGRFSLFGDLQLHVGYRINAIFFNSCILVLMMDVIVPVWGILEFYQSLRPVVFY